MKMRAMTGREALQKAISIAGGQEPLSRRIGVAQSLISYWLNKSPRGVSAERVLDVERETGVSRHDLRPDIYGPSPAAVPIPANDTRPTASEDAA
ncbi:YdaS family helix-turn-helix protein [Xanthobacter flavus]|uniref:transcriptional regulator n=1 Tax=Xanthobacter flavus TaxID=281 RepID=UPI003727E694